MSVKSCTALGTTPLHYACELDVPRILTIEYLIQHGADVNQQSNEGRPPLRSVRPSPQSYDVMRLLINRGALVSQLMLRRSKFECYYDRIMSEKIMAAVRALYGRIPTKLIRVVIGSMEWFLVYQGDPCRYCP